MKFRTFLYVYTDANGRQLASVVKPAEDERDAGAIASILRSPVGTRRVDVYEIAPVHVAGRDVNQPVVSATDDVGDGTGDGNAEPQAAAA